LIILKPKVLSIVREGSINQIYQPEWRKLEMLTTRQYRRSL